MNRKIQLKAADLKKKIENLSEKLEYIIKSSPREFWLSWFQY